ncbi:MAG TPA: T9SS type A sorting domain-containing protein [Hymenobacter sp.]|uniref:T9SS type A sorting domain-containing protein n=1 Tax=Hymenobacter sp. TaxID=1898978 RepID=UPI002ED7FF5C
MDDYATMNSAIGLLSVETIRMALAGAGIKGDRAGVVVSNVASNKNVVNLNGLGIIRLVTYNGSTKQETETVSAAVAKALLESDGRPTQLEFVANLPFTAIQLEIGGVAAVSYKLNVHYAYAVPSLIQTQAKGVLSQFAATGNDLAPYYGSGTSHAGVVSVCANAGVTDPQNAVDGNLGNFAQFNSLATVSCPSALSVKLATGLPAPGGYYAGFVIGNDGLLDASLLSGLRVSTYRNGVATGESATGAGILELRALPDGKSQVSFPTTLPFDEVRIERVGLLSALDNLELYYGFGVEPKAFQGTTRALSDFGATPATGTYKTEQTGICVPVLGRDCGVTNPAGAADNNPNTTATMNLPTVAFATTSLTLDLNAPGVPGNRAGMVIGSGTGLLDLAVLSQMTITTRDAAGNVIESASGASLLSLTLLPNGQQEISFLTTRPFAKVELTVASGLSLLSSFPIHYAFADDRSGSLPTRIVPLPVTLSAFGGKWANGGTDLTWATSSEKNSSHFVVERSIGRDAAFQVVGRVNAAGNSSAALAYKLRDAEAAAQGVSVLYYRLRQVDVDGTTVFSPMISVAVGKLAVVAPEMEVYPNPAPDAQIVKVRCLNLPATGGVVETFSQLGQLVSRQPVTAAAAGLQLPTLASGLYHMVLRDAAGQQLATQRLVIGNR